MRENLFIVFDGDPVNRAAVKSRIDMISSRAPLSKFGIVANHSVVTFKELLDRQNRHPCFDGGKLWLYLNGKVHQYEQVVDFKEWVEHRIEWQAASKNVPPILSNVEVYQQEVPFEESTLA